MLCGKGVLLGDSECFVHGFSRLVPDIARRRAVVGGAVLSVSDARPRRYREASERLSRLGSVDRDQELQAMQMYGAEDAEDLAMILDRLDKSWPPATTTPERGSDTTPRADERVFGLSSGNV